MAYHIEIELSAAKALDRIEKGDRRSAERIDKAIKGLAEDPRPAGATKLVGVGGWRIRVGNYRVIYTVTDAVAVVTVTKVGHRRDVYDR